MSKHTIPAPKTLDEALSVLMEARQNLDFWKLETRRQNWHIRQLTDALKKFDALIRRLEGTEIEYGLAVELTDALTNAHEVMIKVHGVEATMDWIDKEAK